MQPRERQLQHRLRNRMPRLLGWLMMKVQRWLRNWMQTWFLMMNRGQVWIRQRTQLRFRSQEQQQLQNRGCRRVTWA